MASASVIQSPVRLETNGVCGARRGTCVTISAKRSTIGSIIGEWNACEVASFFAAIPRLSSSSATEETDSWSPEITVSLGALKPAIETVGPRTEPMSLAVARTASMAPDGSSCMSRARRATKRQSVVAGEDARDARRDVIAEAVADHGVGLDAPVLPELRERVAGHEQRRLCDRGLGQLVPAPRRHRSSRG